MVNHMDAMQSAPDDVVKRTRFRHWRSARPAL